MPQTSNSIVARAAFFASGNSIRSSKRSCLSLRASCTTALPAKTDAWSFTVPSRLATVIAFLSPTPIHSSPNASGSVRPPTVPPANAARDSGKRTYARSSPIGPPFALAMVQRTCAFAGPPFETS